MPEAGGVVIVNREYKGQTPTGMTFGELASMTGGGVQTPGFMGHGRHFISSKKFVKAEGGVSMHMEGALARVDYTKPPVENEIVVTRCPPKNIVKLP